MPSSSSTFVDSNVSAAPRPHPRAPRSPCRRRPPTLHQQRETNITRARSLTAGGHPWSLHTAATTFATNTLLSAVSTLLSTAKRESAQASFCGAAAACVSIRSPSPSCFYSIPVDDPPPKRRAIESGPGTPVAPISRASMAFPAAGCGSIDYGGRLIQPRQTQCNNSYLPAANSNYVTRYSLTRPTFRFDVQNQQNNALCRICSGRARVHYSNIKVRQVIGPAGEARQHGQL